MLMLVKISTFTRLEIRKEDEVTIQRLIIVPSQESKISNIL